MKILRKNNSVSGWRGVRVSQLLLKYSCNVKICCVVIDGTNVIIKIKMLQFWLCCHQLVCSSIVYSYRYIIHSS